MLVSSITNNVRLASIPEILNSVYIEHFCLSVPVLRQKALFRGDLRNGSDLNNQTLWNDRTM